MITAVAVGTTWLFLPKLDYLPTGNRNFVFGFVQPPAGYNLNTVNSLTERIAERTRKNWASETGPESAPGEPPKFKRFIRVAFNGRAFIGGTSVAGGFANVPGSWWAALFMFLMVTMLNTFGLTAGVRLIRTGVIIVCVITLAGGRKT